VKVNYISLVNLILDKPSVKELIQHDFSAENLEAEFLHITGDKREEILSDYAVLKDVLGNSGASAKAAGFV
jgi:lipid-A-disaccharide synthase